MNGNRAIGRLVRIFLVAYAILALRQIYVQIVAGPRLATNPYNPRVRGLDAYRGSILARDGSVLARSSSRGRVYPFGGALAHAIGYDSARYGTAGLEASFDAALAAHPVPSDAFAQIATLLHARAPEPAVRGASLVTTIDPHLERVLASSLANYPRAAGIALDPRTGEVLALASVPTFDPASVDRTFSTLAHDRTSPLLDRSLDGLYPPGSTFKIFTAGAALDAGTVTTASTWDDDGAFPVGRFVVHDNEGEATGRQDLAGAFALSSNVDFAQIALGLGVDGWYAAARNWKLGESLGFDLPVERDRLPARAELTPSVLAQLGFGQADLLVTPLRMATIAATVAAGGSMPRPFLVRALRADGRDRIVGRPETLATPLSSGSAADLTAMMIAVVARGTGRAAAIDGTTVAGKTGTATNPAGRSHAWFVAFAPAAAPRIAVAIVVENAGYGGVVAAPIARRVIAAALGRDG